MCPAVSKIAFAPPPRADPAHTGGGTVVWGLGPIC